MTILYLITGLLLGCLITWLYVKSTTGKQDSLLKPYEEKINTILTEKSVVEERLKNTLAEKERLVSEHYSEKDKLALELKEERSKLNEANVTIARAREAFKNQEEKITSQKAEMEEMQKRFTLEFENIANKILEDKSKRFTEQNKTNLDIILNPLKEKIKSFEEQVEKAYKSESAERITLKTEIKHLVELNKQISEEANNLAKALKGDNKKQGNWGEMMLDKILERSGLTKDVEYKTQVNVTTEDGKRVQPDVVIFLPDNKHIIIDSKVSLVDYDKAINSATEEEREIHVRNHIVSVRTHVKGLSEKEYQNTGNLSSPDFVLLFIPIESSFSIAVQADQELFNFAWERKIVIVSPSTLLATLRTIASVWKQERQTKNALEIAEQGGKLYDKFVGFVEDMKNLGDRIRTSQKTYDDAMNKLTTGTGNLVNRAENLRKLGAKNSKKLDHTLAEKAEDNNSLT